MQVYTIATMCHLHPNVLKQYINIKASPVKQKAPLKKIIRLFSIYGSVLLFCQCFGKKTEPVTVPKIYP